MKKRCEGMLEIIEGTYERCDNLAQRGSDFCWECRQFGNKKAVQLRDDIRGMPKLADLSGAVAADLGAGRFHPHMAVAEGTLTRRSRSRDDSPCRSSPDVPVHLFLTRNHESRNPTDRTRKHHRTGDERNDGSQRETGKMENPVAVTNPKIQRDLGPTVGISGNIG
jgi:hypothetical protein